jgi:uncharacterized protein (TIGR04255 family)
MQVQRHYSKAPITEAIIDLQVAFPEGFPVDRFADIHSHISDLYPVKEPIYTGIGSFVFQPGTSVQVDANQQQNGYLYKSKDNLKIFQATLRGFTFNRLAPYASWEEFSSDARYLWKIYKDICEPMQVTRTALRYVNQINIPFEDAIDLKDYLNTVPEVAEGLPKNVLSSFFMQLQIPQDDLNCILVINEALLPPTYPGIITVILDFDLYRQQIWQKDDEGIWDFLKELRHRKNLAFNMSITNKTRRLID